MSNKMYNILKWVAIALVPSAVTLVGMLSNIWGWANGEQIMLTIGAIGTFLAGILGISNYDYNKKITQDPPLHIDLKAIAQYYEEDDDSDEEDE